MTAEGRGSSQNMELQDGFPGCHHREDISPQTVDDYVLVGLEPILINLDKKNNALSSHCAFFFFKL